MTESAQGPWHKTTDELITAAEEAIRALGFRTAGEAVERWEGDGVMLVTPERTAHADDDHHWYLCMAGTDNKYVDEPGIDVIVIGPKASKYDLHECLRDWDHLRELLTAGGYLTA